MKYQSNLKKIICGALAALTLLTFPSCGKSNGVGKSGEKVKLEHVYTTKYIDINFDENENTNNFITYNQNVYVSTYKYVESKEDGSSTNYNCYYRINPDDGTKTLLFSFESVYKYDEATQKSSGETYDSFVPGENNTFWCSHSVFSDDYSDPQNYQYNNKLYITNLNEKGTIINEKDLSTIDDGINYIERIVVGDGFIILKCNTKFYIVDSSTFALKNTVDIGENANMDQLVRLGDGSFVGVLNEYTQDSNTTKLVSLDPISGKFNDIDAENFTNIYQIYPGEGTTLYFDIGSGIYKYDITTKTQSEELNWLNSDINSSRVNNICAITDGRFIVNEFDSNYENRKIAVLSKASENDIVEKYIIKFASVYLNDEMRDAVISFNKQNADYRISYIDYSIYNTNDDYEGGTKQLNNDIISGNIPDIINMGNLPYSVYASKGLLADLGALMDKDTEFNRADYVESILKATEFDGKLYSIIPEFDVVTLVGKTDNVGDITSWKMSDLIALKNRFPDAAIIPDTTRSTFLYYFSELGLEQFIDRESGKCTFNTEDFYKVLELAKDLPEEINYDNMDDTYWQQQDSQFRENRALLQYRYISSYQYLSGMKQVFGGDYSYVGFPVPEGSGSAINPSCEIAISGKTGYTDVCWQFIKYLMSKEYLGDRQWNFTIRRDCMEEQAKKALENQNNIFVGGGIVNENKVMSSSSIAVAETGSSDDVASDTTDPSTSDENVLKTTQADIDKVNALIDSVSSVNRYESNNDIYAVIEEEAGAFFAGQKSAQDVANVIQSRVQIIIQEAQ